MKKSITIFAMTMLVAGALMASEDWRGNNRLSGYVVDKNTGKPVPNAKVMLRIQRGGKGGPDVTADANGKWAVLGMNSGVWNIDVEAPGYVVRQIGNLQISEGQRIPPMKIEMEPAVVVAAAAPEAPPVEEVKIGGQVVSKDIAEAVEAGNTALTAKNFKDAVASYEKASAALPTFTPIRFALARAYYGAGDLKKAVATMGDVYTADPANSRNAMLYANMLLEDGQLEKGKSIVDKLPADAVDATALTNIGIVLMNKKQPGAARDYFTKVIEANPKDADGYYYRGLATIQAGKAKEAKSDLQKVIELAPDSDQAKEAKEYLKSIK
ncbi:MAG: Carboxypeptidase regulatory-like domain [Thermoanaerobaculia bacterium]|nr:Carboxypeptidase regulatory-like domain [Thermoanaerobaculia bacterium]